MGVPEHARARPCGVAALAGRAPAGRCARVSLAVRARARARRAAGASLARCYGSTACALSARSGGGRTGAGSRAARARPELSGSAPARSGPHRTAASRGERAAPTGVRFRAVRAVAGAKGAGGRAPADHRASSLSRDRRARSVPAHRSGLAGGRRPVRERGGDNRSVAAAEPAARSPGLCPRSKKSRWLSSCWRPRAPEWAMLAGDAGEWHGLVRGE
jgi:hypothetical protein